MVPRIKDLITQVNFYCHFNNFSSMLRQMPQVLVSTPREDKAVFRLRPCIVLLKVAKTFEKISLEALN